MYSKFYDDPSNATIYMQESEHDNEVEVAAVIRICADPDEALLVTGPIPSDLMFRSNLVEILADAASGDGKRHDERLSSDCHVYLACTGKFKACMLALEGIVQGDSPALFQQIHNIAQLSGELLPKLRLLHTLWTAFYTQMRWKPGTYSEEDYEKAFPLVRLFEDYDLDALLSKAGEAASDTVVKGASIHEP